MVVIVGPGGSSLIIPGRGPPAGRHTGVMSIMVRVGVVGVALGLGGAIVITTVGFIGVRRCVGWERLGAPIRKQRMTWRDARTSPTDVSRGWGWI